MLPKQGSKGTVIGAADPKTDYAERHVGLGQELLGALDPAPEDVLVGGLPGGLLEQARKVVRAQLDYGGEGGKG